MSYSQRWPGKVPAFPGSRMTSWSARYGDTLLQRALRVSAATRDRWPWLGAQLRRLILLIFWTCTLQLGVQARAWVKARRIRQAAPASAGLEVIKEVRAETLSLPADDRPAVSVIVPTYGKVDYTLRCLASIAMHRPTAPIEVIVVDDAFPGPETDCLRQVQGIRLMRNSTNLGFLHSCNAAARQARGEWLLFLNNDTQVLPGWLDSMLDLFHEHSDIGAVGSKLLNPDGTLQEAGAIIWDDGTGWNYGRRDDPDRPEYNYVREVDYCSGASLMVRCDVFLRMDGFDPRFAPAYFEETDLCFRLRAHGLKTLYQPRSQVVHFEGISHGHDLAMGVMAVNRRTFVRRWKATLDQAHYPDAQHVLRARERGRGRGVALVVDHKLPEPDRDAGSQAILGVVRTLLDADMLVKFWPTNLAYVPGYTEALQQMGVEVFHGPRVPAFPAWLREYGPELDLVGTQPARHGGGVSGHCARAQPGAGGVLRSRPAFQPDAHGGNGRGGCTPSG